MEPAFVPSAQQCSLAPGQVSRWQAQKPAVLVVRQGRAWATLDSGPFARAPRGGDWFLDPGMELAVPSGRVLLVEAAGREAVVFGIRTAEM